MIRRLMARVGDLLALVHQPRALVALFSWPCFSLSSYRLVSVLVKKGIAPRTIIDVGANVGQFATAASKLFQHPKIYSFEPIPEAFERLQRSVAALSNVVAYELALGQRESAERLHLSANSVSSSFLDLTASHEAAFPNARIVTAIDVRMSTLDAVFAAQDLARPSLLKLDVQGYEADVIYGGRQTLAVTDYVLTEASLVPMYKGEASFRELANLLETHGFQFAGAVGALESPRTGEILQIDALFCRSGKNDRFVATQRDGFPIN